MTKQDTRPRDTGTAELPQFDRTTASFRFPGGGHTLSFFATLCLKVTGACPAHCAFCSEPDRRLPQAPAGEWEPLIGEAVSRGTSRFSLSGGEPLLYSEVGKLLKLIKGYGATTLVATAAPDLVLRLARPLAESLDYVRFSLLGVHENHDKRLGRKGAFALLPKAIAECRRRGVQTLVSTVATKQIVLELDEIVRWAGELGIRKLYVFELLDSGSGAAFRVDGGGVQRKDTLTEFNKASRRAADFDMVLQLIPNDLFGENVLCYADGRVVIDPIPSPPGQMALGNWRREGLQELWKRFASDKNRVRSLAARARLY